MHKASALSYFRFCSLNLSSITFIAHSYLLGLSVVFYTFFVFNSPFSFGFFILTLASASLWHQNRQILVVNLFQDFLPLSIKSSFATYSYLQIKGNNGFINHALFQYIVQSLFKNKSPLTVFPFHFRFILIYCFRESFCHLFLSNPVFLLGSLSIDCFNPNIS